MEYPVRAVCPECRYARVVREDGDRLATDHVVEHGRETGQILTIERVADRAHTGRAPSVR